MKITYLVEGASFASVIWKSHSCIKPFILLNFRRCEVNHIGDKSPIFIDKWPYGTCKSVDHFSCSPCICSKSWVQLALAHILPMGSINWHCGCFHNHSLLAHLGELFALNRNIYQLFIYARDWCHFCSTSVLSRTWFPSSSNVAPASEETEACFCFECWKSSFSSLLYSSIVADFHFFGTDWGEDDVL